MSANIKFSRGEPKFLDIISGEAVRGPTWASAADTINWCLASGEVLVPAHNPGRTAVTNAAVAVFNFKVTPNIRSICRVWRLTILATSGTGAGTVRLTDNLGTSQDYELRGYVGSNITYVEKLDAKSALVTNITLTVTIPNAGVSADILSIACYEGPRSYLDLDTNDYGIDLLSEEARQPINCLANQSIGGVVAASAQTFLRHYHAAARDATKGKCWSNATTAYTYLTQDGVILTKKVYISSTTGKVVWRFYCSISDQSYGGTIKITNSNASLSTYIVVPASLALSLGFLWYETTFDATWARVTTVMTLTKTAHGFTAGENIYISESSDTTALPLGSYTIASVTANTIVLTVADAGGASGTCAHDLRFDCEDLSEATGMPTATVNEFDIEFKSENVAGTFYVASQIGEEEI